MTASDHRTNQRLVQRSLFQCRWQLVVRGVALGRSNHQPALGRRQLLLWAIRLLSRLEELVVVSCQEVDEVANYPSYN